MLPSVVTTTSPATDASSKPLALRESFWNGTTTVINLFGNFSNVQFKLQSSNGTRQGNASGWILRSAVGAGTIGYCSTAVGAAELVHLQSSRSVSMWEFLYE
jgi:hypothetical protein